MRPTDILSLGEVLESLAQHGAVQPEATTGLWLRSVGAVHPDSSGLWLFADRHWLRHVLPAADKIDLIRRTAIRDPLYHFHLDTMLAEVLEAIGRGARWQRLEGLLFGSLMGFSSRFVQLLELAKESLPYAQSGLDWVSLHHNFEGDNAGVFAEWDKHLWADVPGGPAALFPVLAELYVPFFTSPVNVHAELHALQCQPTAILASVVECAKNGESHLVDLELQPQLKLLYKLGLPIRCWQPESTSPDRRLRVGLIAPVRLLSAENPPKSLEGTVVVPLDRSSLKQCLAQNPIDDTCYCRVREFLSKQESSAQRFAFPGLSFSEGWPERSVPAPPGAQLPSATDLRGMALSKKRSPGVDTALQMLADQVVYGLLLQILLLEALDRELGQDSLLLAAPRAEVDGGQVIHAKIFYRPTQGIGPQGEKMLPPAYELGDLECVMDQVSRTLGIEAAGFTYVGQGLGFWTSAILALKQIGILALADSRDRYSLTLEVLDRLHSGELMSRVIRKGQQVRDSIRACLNGMWGEIDKARIVGTQTHAR